MRKIEVQKSGTYRSGAQIVTSNHPAERDVLHLSWEDLAIVVQQAQALLDSRFSFAATTCGLTESELAQCASGEDIGYDEDIS